MNRPLLRLVACTVLLLLGPAAASLAATPSPAPAAAPRLVVIVSVDGLSWPRLNGYRPWYTAGLKRLLDTAQVQTQCNYQHINTETGPGHASLSTGAPPRVHGIVANRWYEVSPDGTKMKRFYCTDQADPKAPTGAPIPGPANLRIDTLADRLVAASPTSRVVALAGKDRAAILLAGHNRNHIVYWFDRSSGRFRSSNAYDSDSGAGADAKSLVEDFNRANGGGMLLHRFGTIWRPLPAPPSAAGLPHAEPDLTDFQVTRIGLGFDHDLAREQDGYFEAIYGSPFQDELLADLALAVLASPKLQLGQRGVPDILALSFSANDVISHDFGSESEEDLDTLRRLDLQIGRLFEALDRVGPPGSVALALSADHGFTALPEVTRRAATDKRVGSRLLTTDRAYPNFLQVVNRSLAEALCVDDDPKNPLLFGGDGWTLAYNRATLPRTRRSGCAEGQAPVASADLDRVLPGLITDRFEEQLGAVLLVSERASWPTGGAAEFARNDFDAARSGDAFLIPRDNVLLYWDPTRGSGHGSQYPHDTNVPLIFWGAAFPAGERSEPAAPYDLAPTLAQLLGVKLPDATGTSRVVPSGKPR